MSTSIPVHRYETKQNLIAYSVPFTQRGISFGCAVDADAILTSGKAKRPGAGAISLGDLKDIFIELNYDTEIREEPEEAEEGAENSEEQQEEDGEAKADHPPPEKKMSQFAEQLFSLVAPGRDSVELDFLATAVYIAKNGWGEVSMWTCSSTEQTTRVLRTTAPEMKQTKSYASSVITTTSTRPLYGNRFPSSRSCT